MIESVIYLLAYLLTEFMNYLLVYVIIFQASVNRSKRRWIICVGTIMLIHGLVMYYEGEIVSSNISMFTMLVIPLFLLATREKKNLYIYPFIVIGTSAIVISASFILALVMDMPEYLVIEDNWLNFLCQCVTTIMLIILFTYRKVRGYKKIQVQLSIQQYVLFYIAVICIFLMLASMQIISEGDLSDMSINTCGFAVSMSSITFVILVIWQGIVVNNEIQLKERNEMNEKYMEMQIKHFNQVIDQDEKMRRFRHDINAHMTVLKSLSGNGNNEELDNYLKSIIEEATVFEEQYTGNKGTDAIVRELFDEAKSKNINVELNGTLPEDIKVSVYDLCTIFSNLIKNAIEACEKIEEVSGRLIKIDIGTYNSLLFIKVENTISEYVIVKDNQLITSKADKKNHGLGSGNVENVVKKNGGYLKYKCENGWFKTEIQM